MNHVIQSSRSIMSNIERFYVIAFGLTIPGAFHMWLAHPLGVPNQVIWQDESWFYVIYDIYTMGVFSLIFLAIVSMFAFKVFQEQITKWQYSYNLNKLLRRDQFDLHLSYRAKSTGFNEDKLKDSDAVRFKVKSAADSVEQFEQEIADYLSQLTTRKIEIEDIKERFRRRIKLS